MSENMTPEQEDEIIEQMRWGRGKSDIFEPLALRRMDAQAAEIDRLRAEHAADCIRFAEILEREGFRMDGRVFRAKAAALASDARDGAGTDAGAPAGDADADGDGGTR